MLVPTQRRRGHCRGRSRWTRLPYLCSGTTERTYYHLDNALLLLRRTQGVAPAVLGAVLAAEGGHRQLAGRADAATLPALCKGPAQEWPAFTWLGGQVKRHLASRAQSTWGDVLDSGLGKGSLCWLLRQPLRTLTGVTAQRDNSAYGHSPLQRAVRHHLHVRLLLGNWRNASLVGEARYDVVRAFYRFES